MKNIKNCGEVPCSVLPLVQPISETVPSLEIKNLFPNPVQESLFVQIETSKAQAIQAMIFNNYGQEMMRLNFDLEEGSKSLEFDLKGLQNGLYHLVIPSMTTNKVQRFLKADLIFTIGLSTTF